MTETKNNMATLAVTSRKLKNGNTSFTINLNGKRKKIAEAQSWKSGFSLTKFALDGKVPTHNGFANSYDPADLDGYVCSWAEQITGDEFDAKIVEA